MKRVIRINIKVGDIIKYNGNIVGNCNENFIRDSLKYEKFYRILEIDDSWFGSGVPRYLIRSKYNGTFWLPYYVFDPNLKDMYDLR